MRADRFGCLRRSGKLKVNVSEYGAMTADGYDKEVGQR